MKYKVTINDDPINQVYKVTITKESIRKAFAENDIDNLINSIMYKVMEFEEKK